MMQKWKQAKITTTKESTTLKEERKVKTGQISDERVLVYWDYYIKISQIGSLVNGKYLFAI